jgi:GntR family transcriptional regulator
METRMSKTALSNRELVLKLDQNAAQPRFRQIQDALLEFIATGVLKPGDQLPPLRQWAGKVGVAYETMSKAVRGLVGSGVLEARPKWGTRVSARGVDARRRIGAVGVVVAEYFEEFMRHSRFYGRLTPMLQDELMKEQERVTFERWEPGMAMPAMFNHLATVDGMILMGNVRYPVEGILAVENLGLPVLFIGGELTDLRIHIVRSDDFSDCREAVRELAAMGHREIAAWVAPDDLRGLGYDRGLIDTGLPRRPEYILTGISTEKIVQRLVSLRKRPTALFVTRHLDQMSDLARRLDAAGLRVGKDIHLCVYDDDLWQGLAPLGVPYSRIEQPLASMASEAARIILSRIEGRYEGPAQVLLRSRFVRVPASA